MPLFIIKALIFTALIVGYPVQPYGDNTTLNEGIVITINGNFNPLDQTQGCQVVGYESRGEPGYFFGEC